MYCLATVQTSVATYRMQHDVCNILTHIRILLCILLELDCFEAPNYSEFLATGVGA